MVNMEENKAPLLIDVVFSWSIADVMNKNLYKDKVKRIPDTFPSACDYLKSFVIPLVEETHADLRSSMTTLESSPTREICEIKRNEKHKPSRALVYEITLKKLADGEKKPTMYEPEVGDLIALMDVVPKSVRDLIRQKRPYTIALVQKSRDDCSVKIPILSSKPISFQKEGNKLFAVYITNLTTNMRIWSALHPGEGKNMKVINSVLSYTPAMEESCALCSSSNINSINLAEQIQGFSSLGLNDSQKAAVSNCIAAIKCHHRSNTKLIWGPPGTGKTKTVTALAFSLLEMQHRTLICAPTNVAVTGVTKSLIKFLSGVLELDTYGLGDIVLFGTGERLKIDEHEDLSDVFLPYRIETLAQCMHPLKGWNGCLDEMISLLQNPVSQYARYLNRQREKLDDDSNSDQSDDDSISEDEHPKGKLIGNIWKKTIIQNIKANKKKESKELARGEGNHSIENKHLYPGSKGSILWSFEEFFTKKFSSIGRQLIFCINGLYTHLPSCWLPTEVLPSLFRAHDMLQVLGTHLDRIDITDKGHLRRALFGRNEMGNINGTTSLCGIRLECLKILEILRKTFVVPCFIHYRDIKDFCLENACLVFCTVSSSARFHWNGVLPFEMVIVDEAAQLKECESCVPLQLPGLRHAVLVGDEKQLPAMVESKICEKAGFGRSLFERLATLGHSKHLLNVQYRMHPSICLFPNEEFYAKQIKNGPNVMEKDYGKLFLRGKGGDLYLPYSFINVTNGTEVTDTRRSRKNILEVSVVTEIVSKLYRESVKSRKTIRVGCISPYNAQVLAIQEAFGNTYSTDASDAFSVSVRSVDGFQGGEEDIIIISTVRCNRNGSIGFLDNPRRTNVALTRARHCLWILGDETTLSKSNSIWQKLVANAKDRGCFHNAYSDEDLSIAIASALIDLNQMASVFSMDSILFKAAKWKVFFSAKFHGSIARIQDTGIHKQVAALLAKIADGWRQRYNAKTVSQTERPSSLLLEWCDVRQQLKLIWTVNIFREKNSTETQVIEVLDLLSRHEFPQLAKEFDRRYYSVGHLNRCLCKRLYRGLILPVTWPVDSVASSSSNSTSDPEGWDITSQLAAMSVRDKPTSDTRRDGNRHWRSNWNRKMNN